MALFAYTEVIEMDRRMFHNYLWNGMEENDKNPDHHNRWSGFLFIQVVREFVVVVKEFWVVVK